MSRGQPPCGGLPYRMLSTAVADLRGVSLAQIQDAFAEALERLTHKKYDVTISSFVMEGHEVAGWVPPHAAKMDVRVTARDEEAGS